MRKERKPHKPLPLREWQLSQRARAQKRLRLRRWIVGIGMGALLLASTIAIQVRPLLIWNASASAPIGLYYIDPRSELKPGDHVAVWLPEAMRQLAARRRYLPANIPAIKGVAAIEGDRVCAFGSSVFVNDQHVAERLSTDSAERPMPSWEGCTTLGENDFFLLNPDVRNSFDGRYTGISRSRDVIGKATLLWAE